MNRLSFLSTQQPTSDMQRPEVRTPQHERWALRIGCWTLDSRCLSTLPLLATVLLSGCVAVPTPSDRSQLWEPPQDAQKADAVWTAVRARTPDLSKPLSLAQLVDIALQNSPQTRKAWSDARAAAAQVEQAQGYFMPELTATAGANRHNVSADPDTFSQEYLKYGPALKLNYLVINLGGGRRAAVEQALQTVYAADFAFNRTIQDTLLATEISYYALISAQAGLEATGASVKDAKTALEAAQERKATGLGTQLDVLQAQAGYDRSLYTLAGAQGLLKITQTALAQAVGLPADAPVLVEAPSTNAPETPAAQSLQPLIDDAIRRRPDIAALRAVVAAREAAVIVAGATLWPSLFLNGSLSRDAYETYSGRASQDNDVTYDAGIALQWTWFDGFRTQGAKRQALAELESTKAQLEQAELAAGAQVSARRAEYETALQRQTFSEAYLRSASASYDLALDAYKAGLKGILDLLNAEDQLAQARRQSIEARLQVFTSLANLAYAAGVLDKDGAAQAAGLLSTPTRKDPQP